MQGLARPSNYLDRPHEVDPKTHPSLADGRTAMSHDRAYFSFDLRKIGENPDFCQRPVTFPMRVVASNLGVNEPPGL